MNRKYRIVGSTTGIRITNLGSATTDRPTYRAKAARFASFIARTIAEKLI
jgi:hypothetical protein